MKILPKRTRSKKIQPNRTQLIMARPLNQKVTRQTPATMNMKLRKLKRSNRVQDASNASLPQ